MIPMPAFTGLCSSIQGYLGLCSKPLVGSCHANSNHLTITPKADLIYAVLNRNLMSRQAYSEEEYRNKNSCSTKNAVPNATSKSKLRDLMLRSTISLRSKFLGVLLALIRLDT